MSEQALRYAHGIDKIPGYLRSRPIVYIAHPLSGSIRANRSAAAKWVSWAGKLGLAPSATWIVLSGEWTEEEGRAMGLEIDKAHIERCDYLFLCGPRVSGGMNEEWGPRFGAWCAGCGSHEVGF